MKSNKNFRKDDLSPESNTKKIYKMYKRKKQWVVAPVVFGLLLNALSPIAALAVTETNEDVKTVQVRELSDSELEALRAEALNNISILVSLTTEAKDQYTKAVEEATTGDEIKNVLKEARRADVVETVEKEKNGYASEINALSLLTDVAKANYISTITGLGLNNLVAGYDEELRKTDSDYGVAKAAFDAKLLEIKEAAKEIVEQAVAENTALANLPQYRVEQKAVVNGLTQLAELKKQDYVKQIDAAETKDAIDEIVTAATSENTTLLDGKIVEKIAELKEEAAKIQAIDRTKYAELIATIDGVGTEATDTTLNKLIALEANIAKEVQDVLDGDLATQLKTAKTNLKTEILNDKRANDLITDTEVKQFTSRVEAAKTIEALTAVEGEWRALVAAKNIEKQSTADARAAAKLLIEGLELDTVTKNNFLASLEFAKDSTAIAKIVVEAQTAARDFKEKNEAELKAAKEQAVKEINALKNLSKDSKETVIGQVNSASNLAGVAEWLEVAKRDDATLQLEKEKETAKAKINGFVNLSEEDKELYQGQIDDAENSSEITEVLNEAIYADYQAGVATADLADAKVLAKEAVNKLENLTASEKTAAFKDIDKATTVDQITAALDLAKVLDGRNAVANEAAKAFEKYKEDKKVEIDGLEFLSKEMKNGYKAEINLAKSIEDVDDVINKARAADTKIRDEKTALDNKKKELVDTIKNSSELTDTEKKQFMAQTFDCKSIEEVETLTDKITQLVSDRTVANAGNDYKDVIKTQISELFGLTDGQKDAYNEKVDAAKDKAEAIKVYEAAKAEAIRIFDNKLTNKIDAMIASGSFVDAQKEVNKLKSDVTRKKYQAKLDDSIALTEAKAAANKQIDALENLSIEEKAAAKEKISKLTTKAAVEKELTALIKADNLVHDKELIELAEAQIKAKDFDKAAKTIEKIRDADTKAKLQKQLEDAQKVAPNIKGTGHVSKIGWQKAVDINEIIGTTGRKLALEAVKLSLADVDMPDSAKKIEGGIEYRAHVRNIGWQGFKSNGELAGTTGKSLQMEAIQIRLTGELSKRYDIQYRAHSKDKGWSKYVSNGATAGTTGKSLRMEAVQIRLVEKK